MSPSPSPSSAARAAGRGATPASGLRFSFRLKVLFALVGTVGFLLTATLLLTGHETEQQIDSTIEGTRARAGRALAEVQAVRRQRLGELGSRLSQNQRVVIALEAALDEEDLELLREVVQYELKLTDSTEGVLATFTDMEARPVLTIVDGVPVEETGEGPLPQVSTYLEGEEEVLFGQRCASMARAARQFFHAAEFVPDAPPLSDAEYRERIARVMASDPRRERPARTRVVIPGHTDLRAFSRVQERALKEALGGSWKSYLQRGNWRMIFPFSPAHQRNTAGNLVASLEAGHPPIVHLVQFPNVTVNHSVLVISAEESPTEIVFRTYDSNVADGVRVLRYDRVERHFTFPTTTYFAGGRVDVYEIYDGWLF